VWRTGLEPGVAGDQPSDVLGVEPVDVLDGIDAPEHGPGVDVIGDGHLDEDAVDVVAPVQRIDRLEQLFGGRLGVQFVVDALDAEVLARPALHRDVRFAGRVVAHQDRREPRRHVRVVQCVDAVPEVVPDSVTDRCPAEDVTVEDVRHRSPPPAESVVVGSVVVGSVGVASTVGSFVCVMST
jgi:hypothetical protein